MNKNIANIIINHDVDVLISMLFMLFVPLFVDVETIIGYGGDIVKY